MEYSLSKRGSTRQSSAFGRLRDKLSRRRRVARRLSPEFAAENSHVLNEQEQEEMEEGECTTDEGEGECTTDDSKFASTPRRKVFTQLQPVPFPSENERDIKTQEVSLCDWFFGECINVRKGIEKDMNKIKNRLQSEKNAYLEYRKGSWSNKRMLADLEFSIAKLECDVLQFPETVVRSMSLDMLTILNKRSALSMLRQAGPKIVYEWLLTSYVRRWKAMLCKRAVYEFLLESGEGERWYGLNLGIKHVRAWLVSKFEVLFNGGEPADLGTAVFIVEMIFPAKDIEPSCYSDSIRPETKENPGRALAWCFI